MRLRPRWLGVIAVALGCRADARASVSSEQAAVRTLAPVGTQVSSFELRDLDGRPVAVSFPAPGPVVIVALEERDCFSCVNLPYESWQVARWLEKRQGRIIGVVRADSMGVVRDYARRNRLPFTLLVDSSGWTQRTFGTWAHPIMAFMSSDGVIMSIVLRSREKTEHEPIPRYLAALDAWLPARPTVPQSQGR